MIKTMCDNKSMDDNTKGEKIESSPLVAELAERLNDLHKGTA